MNNFVKQVLDAGGDITPLIIPAELTNGTGTFNPSIYNDNGKLLMNMRHCQVTIYHSEKNIFEHQWGPLAYMNPENDITLTTTNYFCEIDDNMMIGKFHIVDFSKLNQKPIWEFIGLEDCRVFRWEDKLYLCGVRRDTTTTGEGRMEMSEIEIDDNGVREVSRFRIPTPGDNKSYCEKNWMPVIDMPYHFVKWCNPTELVKVDPVNKTCVQVYHGGNWIPKDADYRGGSQIISFDDYYICLTHQTYLYRSEQDKKNATYRHAFVIWDKDWNIVKYGEPFSFLDTKIEFCCGMTEYNGDILITFGIQDNAAYLLKCPKKFIREFIYGEGQHLDWGKNLPGYNKNFARMIENEIFEERVYEKYFNVKENDIVFDIGSNIGGFAYSVMKNKPKHVYCIEPSNTLVKLIEKNLNGYPITIINKAIENQESNSNEINRSGVHIYHNDGNIYSSTTFSKIIKDYNIDKIDFMKFDCEGGEYSIFTEENADFIKNNITHMVGEWHINDHEHAVEKFIKFRDLYLKDHNNFRIFERAGAERTKEIFDDNFLYSFANWWKTTELGQFIIYINNSDESIRDK